MHAWNLDVQITEVGIAWKVLNRMLEQGQRESMAVVT
ncbi:MAG: hypothetical protein ACI8QS_003208 [Planctomycetota bacterium]